MNREELEGYLRPLVYTGRRFYAVLLLLLAGAGWLLYSAWLQWEHGHILTGQGARGAIWGIMVANIVNLIGISHVGIAISAVVRLLNLERYRQFSRIAELVTLVSLTTAVVNIGLDVGRPDRFIINVVWYGRYQSPFVWSMTVITAYLVASSVYLYLAMRRDIALCARLVPQRAWLFRILALGYTDTEEERRTHERVLWWLALIILPIMVSVHSVYGLIFGLQAARPGWYNPLMAPYFVLGAIVSGFSAIILLAAVLRKAFGWHEIIPDARFRGLGTFLSGITILYIYFLLSELLTARYNSPIPELVVSNELVHGRFAWLYWSGLVVGLLLPALALFIQGRFPHLSSMPLILGAAALINATMWVVRFLIVVPSLEHPLLPYRIATYHPTRFEWGLMLSTYAFALLFYVILVKLLPVLELPRVPAEEVVPLLEEIRSPRISMPTGSKRAVLTATIVMGAGLVVFGVLSREHTLPSLFGGPMVALNTPGPGFVPASAIWVTGIVILLTIPLQLCVIRAKSA